MRIALITDSFAPGTTYICNVLPRFFEALGVHCTVITSAARPYREKLSGPSNVVWGDGRVLEAGSTIDIDGVTVMVLNHVEGPGGVRLLGLDRALSAIRPDVVQTVSAAGVVVWQVARLKKRIGFELFVGNHSGYSVFPTPSLAKPKALIHYLTRRVIGALVARVARVCFCPTADSLEIAWRHTGYRRDQCQLLHLGVDVDLFRPAASESDFQSRAALRADWGIGSGELVALYTGKLIPDKRLDVAVAGVAHARSRGMPCRLVIYGAGPLLDELSESPGVVVRSFVPACELAEVYRAADMAVWPGDETTSMLDAAATSLPIVISDRVSYREHVEGNGLVVRHGDVESFASALVALSDPALRELLGLAGRAKMLQFFDWRVHAAKRISVYRSYVDAVPRTPR
jgi:glycosyltransferase involved in cell wall biosynthesis